MSTSSAVTSWSPSSFSSERRTSNLSAVWWWTNLAISAAFVDGESSSVEASIRSRTLRSWEPFSVRQPEGALGFVVVPRDRGRAAVAGEDGREHHHGGGLVRPALAVDHGDGAGAGPVLADRADVLPFGEFFRRGVHPESQARERSAPALCGRFQHRGADQERGFLQAAPRRRRFLRRRRPSAVPGWPAPERYRLRRGRVATAGRPPVLQGQEPARTLREWPRAPVRGRSQ